MIRETIDQSCAPIDRRPAPDWLAEHFHCVAPLAIRNCTLRTAGCRHFDGPLLSLHGPTKREVAVRAPCRSGKTLIGEAFLGDRIARDPGPSMWVAEKDPLADQEWDRMQALFLASPAIAQWLPRCTPQGSRRDKQTGEVKLLNGSSLFVHGSAVSNLQQKGIRYLVLDEVWNWRPGRMDEAFGRIGDYLKLGTSKVLIISQGGEDESDWDRHYSRGSCSEWEVQCLGCGQYFWPLWSHPRPDGKVAGMRWDERKDANGMWVPSQCLASVRYECPHCAHPHSDTARTKLEWNRTGRWSQTNPDARPERDSYHWTNCIDYPWAELVDIYLHAINALKVGNIDPLVTFFQKHMAENRSERSILEASQPLHRQIYDLRGKWDAEFLRFFTADVQERELWGTIRAWAKDGTSRRLWFGRLTSYADVEAKRLEYGVKPGLTALDSGHRAKGDNGVYAACARYGWLALKGEQEKRYMHAEGQRMVEHSYSEPGWGDPEIGTVGQGRGKLAPLIRFSADTMADRLDGLISSGRWIEPPDTDDATEKEYKRQMAAEVKKLFHDKITNRAFYRRVLRSKSNHAYDCGKEQVLLATLLDILPDVDSSPKA